MTQTVCDYCKMTNEHFEIVGNAANSTVFAIGNPKNTAQLATYTHHWCDRDCYKNYFTYSKLDEIFGIDDIKIGETNATI